MTDDRIDILADKWLKGTISAAERLELETWYASYESLEQKVNSDQDEEAFGNTLYRVIAARAGIEPALITGDTERVTIKTKLWPRIAAVAAAVAAIVFGVYFFSAPRHSGEGRNPGSARYATDIAPGKNGATITLANGKVIQLSDAKSGVVIGDDKLAYNDNTVIQSDPLSSRANAKDLVASTTKGQTYIFTLPDGTKVWLNAASTLTIPSDFSGTESRKVELTGEAYFEVAKNKKRPFIVESKGQEVTVLGTHFNVSAYADERSIKTTLLEGSVKVALFGKTTPASPPLLAKEGTSIVLKPNQQSVVSGSDQIIVANVDASEAVAWKEGLFSYKEATLETVMRQVARWYDVEIIYETEQLKKKTFGGTVSRYDQVSGILNAISLTGAVKFKIQGKQIIVRE